jgi:hypothetical protein
MATEGLSKKYGTWDGLIVNAKARLPEIPQVEPIVKEFEEVMVDIKELLGIQDVHRRQLRETTLRSKELERRGRSLRNRLVAAMQSIYGVDNLVLVEFGVEPRLPRKRPRLTPEEKVAKLEAELATAKAALEEKG